MTDAMKRLKESWFLLLLWFVAGFVTQSKTFFLFIIIYSGLTLMLELTRNKTTLFTIVIVVLISVV